LVNEYHKSSADRRFILAFAGASDAVNQHVRNKIISTPVNKIEKAVQGCQSNREEGKGSIYYAAKRLKTTVTDLLQYLKQVLSNNDMHYQSISDKVAEELLICSTDHYNAIYESDNTSLPLDQAEQITQWGKSFAVSANTKAKIQDDLDGIEKIRRQATTKVAFAEIAALFADIPKPGELSSNTIQSIPSKLNSFISSCKQPLAIIQSSDADEHLEISNIIVTIVLSLCIEYANKTDDYEKVTRIMNGIKSFRMTPDTKKRFSDNLSILTRNNVAKKSQATKSNDEGCYIATLVYGSYESPEVLILRRFRDDVLATSFLGRAFIHLYYTVSPSLVVLLKNQIFIQKAIRTILNRFVKWRNK
jgi:hypothetical protein